MSRPKLITLLKRRGLLKGQQAVELVTGEPIRGSWWTHPASHRIYDALQVLHASPDVLQVKLIDGKVTYVHRRLWPALVRLQRERPYWPPISRQAQGLLRKVRRRGEVRATGTPRLELERAMLVIGREEHTTSGAHEVVLTPFEAWIPPPVSAAAAKLSLQDALAQLQEAGFTARRRPRTPRVHAGSS